MFNVNVREAVNLAYCVEVNEVMAIKWRSASHGFDVVAMNKSL